MATRKAAGTSAVSTTPRQQQKPWLETITPTAVVVVIVVGLVTLALGFTACALYLQGRLDTAKDCAIQAGAAMTALIALTSRTRPDPAATIEQPADVTASPAPGD